LRRAIITAITALPLLAAARVDAQPAKSGVALARPNIVFIMADDLGYGHLGCYGQKRIRTPRIDRMAREGTRFTQFYAGNCVCAPSRSVLMTGLHSGHTSVRVNGGKTSLRADDVTIAEILSGGPGYTCGIFGKWGIGDVGSEGVPTRQGFDEFFGYLDQVHAHFHYPWYLLRGEEKHPLPANLDGKRGTYSQDAIVKEALRFLRTRKDRPFFLYLPLTVPHFELLVPDESLEEYADKFPEPFPFVDRRGHYAAQPAPRAAFAAMVTRLDRDVGRILDLLAELGLDEKTLVLFTSDNGGYLLDRENFFLANGPLRGAKGRLYEGGIRVPMIVRWPGKVPADRTDDFVWTFWDVLPTLAELAGVKPAAELDGISVAPRLLGRDQKEARRFLYWDRVGGQRGGPPRAQAARLGNWKAVRPGPKRPLELYDLTRDVGETRDVAAANPDLVREIEERLRTATTPCRRYPPQEPTWSWERRRTGFVR